MAEMMADGVEADMTFRDAEILEIRRREMVMERVHTMYRTPNTNTIYPRVLYKRTK